jgi:hypothetical protein
MVHEYHGRESNEDIMLSFSYPSLQGHSNDFEIRDTNDMDGPAMGRCNPKPQEGIEARIPFLGLVMVVTTCYLFEPMG